MIGRVQLPWDSFLPPVQGGIFRTKEQQIEESKLDEGVALTPPTGSTASGTDKRTAIADALDAATPKDYVAFRDKFIDEYESALLKQDLERYPPLDHATQDKIVDNFRKLHQHMKDIGMFQCNWWGYVREASRISLLSALSYYCLINNWLFVSAVLLGLAWHQLTFIAHDSGHQGLTHDYQIDNIIGIFVANFLGGISIGWWKYNHNVHHVVTNDPIHDPDIQHLPFFAVSTKYFGDLYSTFYNRIMEYDAAAKFLIRFQNYTYYFILLFGRFNLYRLSWEYLIKGQGPRKGKSAWFRYLEIVGLLTWVYWFGYLIVYRNIQDPWSRVMYVLISHFCTMPVHAQITLSHFAMSTADIGVSESFPARQLRTTMDVDCPPNLDYVHGGLQFQVIHHLFPRMPRHNYRQVQPYVIEFCKENGLEYVIYGFTKGSQEVLSRLGEIAKQAKILADCTSHLQEEAFDNLATSLNKDNKNKELSSAVEKRKKQQRELEAAGRVNAAS